MYSTCKSFFRILAKVKDSRLQREQRRLILILSGITSSTFCKRTTCSGTYTNTRTISTLSLLVLVRYANHIEARVTPTSHFRQFFPERKLFFPDTGQNPCQNLKEQSSSFTKKTVSVCSLKQTEHKRTRFYKEFLRTFCKTISLLL